MSLAFLPAGMPGFMEIGIIALIILLFFGARKLPGLARALGSSLTEFKKGKDEGERKEEASTEKTSVAPTERRSG